MTIHRWPIRDQGNSLIQGLGSAAPTVTALRSSVNFRHPSLSATLAVLELARKIEPGVVTAMHWYRNVPITELGDLSAQQLVARGRAESVVAFLKSILRGDRE